MFGEKGYNRIISWLQDILATIKWIQIKMAMNISLFKNSWKKEKTAELSWQKKQGVMSDLMKAKIIQHFDIKWNRNWACKYKQLLFYNLKG